MLNFLVSNRVFNTLSVSNHFYHVSSVLFQLFLALNTNTNIIYIAPPTISVKAHYRVMNNEKKSRA